MIDVHAHLTPKSFPPIHPTHSLSAVLSRARSADVTSIVAVSETLEDARAILELSSSIEQQGFVWAAAGIHPVQPVVGDSGETKDRSVNFEDLEGLDEFVRAHIGNEKGNVICIGEVGLDFSPHVLRNNPLNPPGLSEDDLKQIQYEVFRRQIRLAMELDLPVNVHSRSAGHYAIEVLKECGAQNVVMHAFDGRASYAAKGVQLGYQFSIPPSVVRSPQKKSLISTIPLTHLLLETDSPALGPEKGVDNEPANLSVSLMAIAEITGKKREEVLRLTTENALKLFPKIKLTMEK